MKISVLGPISPAIRRAGLMTFRPFNLGKWFVLGFVAWLAVLGEGGGGGGGGGSSGGGGGGGGGGGKISIPTPGGGGNISPLPVNFTMPDSGPEAALREAWQSFLDLSPAIHALIGVGVLLVIAMVLTILWINSRGQFMFIEAIANNTYEVVAPWRRYRHLGNSLFGFRLVMGILGMVSSFAFMVIGLRIAWPDIAHETFGEHAIRGLLIGGPLMVATGIAYALVRWALMNFVVPIMYARELLVRDAWIEFRGFVLRGHVGALICFMLMQIVFTIGILFASVVIGCVTCCVGFLPYLSTVATLPLVVFRYAYPIYFLQQFDPGFVIIREEPPDAGAFPIAPDVPGHWPPTVPPGAPPTEPPYPPG